MAKHTEPYQTPAGTWMTAAGKRMSKKDVAKMLGQTVSKPTSGPGSGEARTTDRMPDGQAKPPLLHLIRGVKPTDKELAELHGISVPDVGSCNRAVQEYNSFRDNLSSNKVTSTMRKAANHVKRGIEEDLHENPDESFYDFTLRMANNPAVVELAQKEKSRAGKAIRQIAAWKLTREGVLADLAECQTRYDTTHALLDTTLADMARFKAELRAKE